MNAGVLTASELETTVWWRGAAIYQVYPRSFADSNGDGVGDLAGVTSRLDHIAALGVDGIWLSPFFTSPMRDFGYDIADFTDVDPIFGTLEDFDTLLARAHALGLKVIIDQVYCHTSDQHAWFHESRKDRTNPKADWYVWADAKADGTPPSNWQSVFGGPAWQWDSRRRQYYLHNFLDSQPDLNVRHPEVQAAILDVARFWLDRGVDGFRVDAVSFAMHDPSLRDNPPAPPGGKRTRPFDYQLSLYNQGHADIVPFLERFRTLLDTYGGRFTVAEVGGDDPLPEMKLFTEGDVRLNSAYGFDFLYADQLTGPVLRRALTAWGGAPGEGWPSWAFSNHDAPRAISRWAEPGQEGRWARLVMLLLVCLRGNIFIYQGEELGLPQGDVPFERLQDPEAIANWPLTLGRDGARTPMPWTAEGQDAGFGSTDAWLPLDPAHRALAAATQAAAPDSMLHWTRRLIALRKQEAALRLGELILHIGEGELVVFERRHGGERIVCAFNLSDHPAPWSLPVGAGMLATAGEATSVHLGALSGQVARL